MEFICLLCVQTGFCSSFSKQLMYLFLDNCIGKGSCQRHGAMAKKCKVEGCDKQAQGTHDGMVS